MELGTESCNVRREFYWRLAVSLSRDPGFLGQSRQEQRRWTGSNNVSSEESPLLIPRVSIGYGLSSPTSLLSLHTGVLGLSLFYSFTGTPVENAETSLWTCMLLRESNRQSILLFTINLAVDKRSFYPPALLGWV